MKTNLFIFSALFALNSLFAQPNFTSGDMPNIGDNDTVMYLNYIGIVGDLDAMTASNYTWDYTMLPFATYPNFRQMDTFRTKKHNVSIPFTNATIEEYIYDGTAGDINLFSLSNDTLYIHRLGAVVTGASYVPPIASIIFPIAFNNSSIANSIIYTGATKVGERKTITKYDGYGNLKMPFGKSYSEVFRVKKVEIDTSYISKSILTYTHYIWYKKGGQIPLLRLTYTGSTNQYFVFGSKANNTSILSSDIQINSKTNTFIRINQNNLEIHGLEYTPESISIYNSMGDEVLKTNHSESLDISTISKGIYLVRINGENKIETQRIIIE